MGNSVGSHEEQGGVVGARLNVKCKNTILGGSDGLGNQPNGGQGGLRLIDRQEDKWWDLYYGPTTENLNFRFFGGVGNGNNGNGGYLINSGAVVQLNFTGQHRLILEDATYTVQDIDEITGLIVISTGVYDNVVEDYMPQVNEALPKVALSSARNQKAVIGVISDAEDNSINREYNVGNWGSVCKKKSADDQRLFVNSVGEGAMWITNINGNLENGDYITSCEIPGYGMRQDDDLLHNYTVAKITQDCEFDLNGTTYMCEEIVHDEATYKRAFVGCTYHCG
jgi:hypothetical protein